MIHFRNLQNIDFPWLLAMLQGSFISHMNTLVVPGGKMGLAMELIMTPLVERLMEGRKIGSTEKTPVRPGLRFDTTAGKDYASITS